MKLVKGNDEALLNFGADLKHIKDAEQVTMDNLLSDMKDLEKETELANQTAKLQADELVKAGQNRPMSLADLREQRTVVRSVNKVAQYNKIDHLTGRTSMERFTLQALGSIQDSMKLTESVKEKFLKLLNYFGEDDKMASNAFFSVIRGFMVEFDKAKEQVEKEEKARVSRFICGDI